MTVTVFQQFELAALTAPELPFLIYPKTPDREYIPNGQIFSYFDALGKVNSLSEEYIKSGYRAGHRVALLFGNRPEHFWHFLALNKIGASIVPLNPAYLEHELEYAIDFSECALLSTAGDGNQDTVGVCSRLNPQIPVHNTSLDDPKIPAPGRTPNVAPKDPAAREALIIYTSGTTGRPKGCIISNTACIAAGESYGTAGGLINFREGGDRIYIPLPAFHMNVSVYTLNTVTRMRNCIILQDRFRVSSWWSDIVETEATCVHYMGIIPPILLKSEPCLEESSHKIKFGQGAGVDPGVREAFESRFGFPLIEAWGMTETSRAIQNCRTPRDPGGRAFGFPRPPLEVMIADEDDNPLPFDTPGELLVRSSGKDPRHGFFSGYLKQTEETENAWRSGWFHTGDIVRQRNDGMLFFVDRKKNIIRRSGENIAAAEVEQVLIDHRAVKSVAVLAVQDELHDEEILAAIELIHEFENCRILAEEIFQWSSSRLALYKMPGWISFLDTIPVTGTQKIQKDLIFDTGVDPRNHPQTFDVRHLKRRKHKK